MLSLSEGLFGKLCPENSRSEPLHHYIPAMLKHSRAAPPSSFPIKVKNINLKQKNKREGKFLEAGAGPAWLAAETCGSFGWFTQALERIPSSVSPPALQHISEPIQEWPL